MKLTYEQLENDSDFMSVEGKCDMVFKYLWKILDKKGMTTYTDAKTKVEAYKNAFYMVKLYCDFVSRFWDTYSDIDGVEIWVDLSEFGYRHNFDITHLIKEDEFDKIQPTARIFTEEIGISYLFASFVCALNDGSFYDDIYEDFVDIKNIDELLNRENKVSQRILDDILNNGDINSYYSFEWLSTVCG